MQLRKFVVMLTISFVLLALLLVFFNMFLLKNYHYIYSYEENEGEQYTLKGVYSVISLKVPATEEIQEAVIFLVKEQAIEKEISLPENFQDFITVYKDDGILHIEYYTFPQRLQSLLLPNTT